MGHDSLLSITTGDAMSPRTLEGKQSAIDMMVLKALSIDAMHGWGISQYIQQVSRDVLQINQGSLYPALHRLERDGYIRAEWRASDNNRRAKYYRLTATGRRQLGIEHDSWIAFSKAVERVMAS
jgi:PadR family transcriptional regulator, regulatory protein PadR